MRLYLNSFPCSRVGENYTNYKKLSYSLGVYPQNFHSAINTSRNKKMGFHTPQFLIYFAVLCFQQPQIIDENADTTFLRRRNKKCQIKHLFVGILIFKYFQPVCKDQGWLLLGEEYCFGRCVTLDKTKWHLVLSLKISH